MPIAIAPSFISNNISTGVVENVEVTTLSDGRFIVSWVSLNAGNYDFKARIYSAGGIASGNEFTVKSDVSYLPFDSLPTITALRDGKFFAHWASDEPVTTGSQIDNFDIRGRLFNANGTPAGSDFVLNSTTGEKQVDPQTAFLPNGTLVVTYTSDDVATGPSIFTTDIRARLFNESGVALGYDFVVNTTTQSYQSAPTITTLKGGGFVVAWQSDESGNSQIRARVYNSAGVANGVDFVVNSLIDDNVVNQRDVGQSVTALANGGFIVTWYSSSPGGTASLTARTFSSSGVPASDEFALVNSASSFNSASMMALADGRLILTWQDVSDPGVVTNAAQLYTDKGVAIGEAFSFAFSDNGSELGVPTFTTLADGRIVASWSGSSDLNDIDALPVVRTSILNPLIYTGTAAANTWIGGTLKDTITGLGGIDDLSGGAGEDVIDGGLGDDILKGDAGNDRMRGGLGNDAVNGGTGIDIAQFDDHFGPFSGGWDINLLTGKATTLSQFTVGLNLVRLTETDTLTSIESVLGSAGKDTIQANQGLVISNLILPTVKPLIDGGAGTDTLILAPTIPNAQAALGSIVADDVVTYTGVNQGSVTTATTLKTGVGVLAQFVAGTGYLDFKNIETLDTGAGNDRVTGSAFKDTVRLGIGNDSATLGLGDDTAFGGAGLDTLTGGDGNDLLYGEADVDTISGGNGIDSIVGGAGADKLTGGLGADKFFYFSASEGTDIISDFAVDDVLGFKGTVFGALPAGALAANNFWTNTTGVAHDADDRFIFNTTDDTLWYDSNGNAAGGAFKMADLNIAFNLTAADILIV
jgi:Ca2+-binding RTX toxin-like protein